MKSTSAPPKPWLTRTVGVFLILLLSYLTWYTISPVMLLGGCMMLSSVIIELGKFEWMHWQLRRAKSEEQT